MKGYKHYKTETDSIGIGNTKYYQRRVDTDEGFDYPLCQCNDRVSINIEVWNLTLNGRNDISCSMSLVHENQNGEWCDLKIYSLTEDELWNNLKSLEDKLLAMWGMFCK